MRPAARTSAGTCFDCSIGGCCFADFTCAIVPAADCAAAGGSFLGGGTDCIIDCSRGACCVGADCYFIDAGSCAILDGTYAGNGVSCDAVTCPSDGVTSPA